MSYNEMLIEEVRKYKCLYDISMKDHRNKPKKEIIWEKVAKTLNTSSESCKRRWKTLRDTYKKTKRANELAYGSCSPPPEKKWKFQEALSFLDNCKESRSTTENIDIIKEDVTSFTEDLIPVNSPITQEFEVSYCGWMDNTVAPSDLDLQSSSSTSMPTPSNGRPSKRRVNDKIKKKIAKAMEKRIVSLNGRAKMPKRNSTFLLFESFAEKITDANLSEADVNQLEVKVLSLVYEELANYSDE